MLSRLGWIRGAAVGLAAMGTLIPRTVVLADGPKVTRPVVRKVEASVLDIALSTNGAFTGRIVDHAGTAIEGAQVTVKQGQNEVARTITDKSGTFTITNLKNGTYSIGSGATTGSYRVWSDKTAPPTANPQALLIMGQNGARGQFAAVDGGGNLLIATLVLLTLGVGIAALVEIEDVKGKIPVSP